MKKFSLLLAFLLFTLACGGNNSGGGGGGGGGQVPKPTFTGAMSCHDQLKSAKGVVICADHKVDAAYGQVADQQLDDVFKIAQNGAVTASGTNHYRPCASGGYEQGNGCFSTHASYQVYLIPRADVCVNPGFSEVVYSPPAPNGYDETYTDDPANHWDKDPRPGNTLLCAAGFMATGHGNMSGIAAPGMGVVDDLADMQAGKLPIIRYEAEHNILAQVDTERYAATQYHYGTNGGHPILGDDVTAAGAKKQAVKRPAKDDTPQAKDGAGRVLWVVK